MLFGLGLLSQFMFQKLEFQLLFEKLKSFTKIIEKTYIPI